MKKLFLAIFFFAFVTATFASPFVDVVKPKIEKTSIIAKAEASKAIILTTQDFSFLLEVQKMQSTDYNYTTIFSFPGAETLNQYNLAIVNSISRANHITNKKYYNIKNLFSYRFTDQSNSLKKHRSLLSNWTC